MYVCKYPSTKVITGLSDDYYKEGRRPCVLLKKNDWKQTCVVYVLLILLIIMSSNPFRTAVVVVVVVSFWGQTTTGTWILIICLPPKRDCGSKRVYFTLSILQPEGGTWSWKVTIAAQATAWLEDIAGIIRSWHRLLVSELLHYYQ